MTENFPGIVRHELSTAEPTAGHVPSSFLVFFTGAVMDGWLVL